MRVRTSVHIMFPSMRSHPSTAEFAPCSSPEPNYYRRPLGAVFFGPLVGRSAAASRNTQHAPRKNNRAEHTVGVCLQTKCLPIRLQASSHIKTRARQPSPVFVGAVVPPRLKLRATSFELREKSKAKPEVQPKGGFMWESACRRKVLHVA